MTINVCFIPDFSQWPDKGGVRTHLTYITECMLRDDEVQLTTPEKADLYHIESAWGLPSGYPLKPIVYVCHGGFIPSPLPVVQQNLMRADMIVSVASWLIPRFFPAFTAKTITIHNGVDLSKLDRYYGKSTNPLGLVDYLVYGKEWAYYIDDVVKFAELNPTRTIVVTSEVDRKLEQLTSQVDNVRLIGNQSHSVMMEILNASEGLLLTGSEVCPTMLLEAWALGVPVIARDIDGNSELMNPGGEGAARGGVLYTDPVSVDIEDEVINNRVDIGLEGRKEVERLFQWKDLWPKYKIVYERLLSGEIYE